MTDRAACRAAALLLAAPLLVVASGCGLIDTGSAGRTSSAVTTSAGPTSTATDPAPSPTTEAPGDVRARVLRDGVPLTSGDVTLVVLALSPTPQDSTGQDSTGQDATTQDPTGQDPTGQDATTQDATAQPDGSARWEPSRHSADEPTATPDDAGTDAATALVAAPDPLTLDVAPDGTVVVRQDGAPVAGLSSTGSGRLSGDGEVLELRGDAGAGVWLAARMVDSLDWGEREGGRSLAVTPSDWARAGGLAAGELVPAQVVAAEPEAGSATMLDQLACHQLGARDKPTWNLEPWRPDVGPLDMIVARCNPTA